jgi:outer membrane protein insertion porin family
MLKLGASTASERLPMSIRSLFLARPQKRCASRLLALLCVLGTIRTLSLAQDTKPAADQTPGTAPATAQILSSYEGQNVTAIEIAGRPESNTAQFTPLFVQHSGEPFSIEKVDQTIAALKATGKFKEVQLQVDPEADGVRILMILEPAVWFGLFQFPGAERFAYSRLMQAANFPPQAPYNTDDVERDRQSLLKFFQQEGYFKADVQP